MILVTYLLTNLFTNRYHTTLLCSRRKISVLIDTIYVRPLMFLIHDGIERKEPSELDDALFHRLQISTGWLIRIGN